MQLGIGASISLQSCRFVSLSVQSFSCIMSVQDVFWSQQVKEADECMDPDTRKRKRPRKALYDTSELQELLRNYEEASQKVSPCLKQNVEGSVV